MTFIFLVAYHFLFAMYLNFAYVTFIFYLYSFSFTALVEDLCCKPKYRANIIHHFIFVFFLYIFYHSSCCKDQFTVLNLKFGSSFSLHLRCFDKFHLSLCPQLWWVSSQGFERKAWFVLNLQNLPTLNYCSSTQNSVWWV